MRYGRQEVRTIKQGSSSIGHHGQQHSVCMAIHMEAGETGGVLAKGDFLQLPRMEERFDVFTQKGSFFPGIGLWVRPSQLFGAYPVGGIGEGHFQGLAVFANSRCSTAMVKMEVR